MRFRLAFQLCWFSYSEFLLLCDGKLQLKLLCKCRSGSASVSPVHNPMILQCSSELINWRDRRPSTSWASVTAAEWGRRNLHTVCSITSSHFLAFLLCNSVKTIHAKVKIYEIYRLRCLCVSYIHANERSWTWNLVWVCFNTCSIWMMLFSAQSCYSIVFINILNSFLIFSGCIVFVL